jgi:hypothetical protein
MTSEEAEKATGLTPQRLRQLAKKGKIRKINLGKFKYFRNEIENYKVSSSKNIPEFIFIEGIRYLSFKYIAKIFRISSWTLRKNKIKLGAVKIGLTYYVNEEKYKEIKCE